MEALWEGGIVAEDGGVFRTAGRTEVEVIKWTSLGPVLLSGGVKPPAPGWEQGRVPVSPGRISARGQLQPAVKT